MVGYTNNLQPTITQRSLIDGPMARRFLHFLNGRESGCAEGGVEVWGIWMMADQ